RTIPLLAPAVHVLFRPEQEHGLSSEDDVLIPMTRGYGEVDSTRLLGELSVSNVQRHFEIAAGAGSGDRRVFFQRGRDAKRVPDAVAVIRVLANVHRKC